ncbi:extracellular solute-binding protein [Paenibacillus antri]|uniref:Extracellular solute-binding protein n=1 Tax=Paenibacillus antri TaxID=2582848 RepID=A0A5R9GCP3_9BACL|nr:extracellular solute-binding protein [Paenibacillus antri]TLS50924.1 extracellular solute-binding protein [Paenibacillus antri]
MANKLGLSLLAAATVFTMVGCTQGGGDSGTGTESSDSSGTQSITYTFGRNFSATNENVAKLEAATGETLEDNRWTRLFKEQLGVTVKYQMLSDSTAYDQKFKLAMASADLPDIFQVTQAADMKQLMEAGAIEELGPLFETHGSDLLKSIVLSETDRVFEPATYDGKIYGIPMKMPSTNGYNHLWIREDWLTKLGLERPKTIDDVYKIAVAFAKNDPDGNGQADTFGLQIDNNFRYNMQGLFWAFGAYPLNWIEKDGKAVRGVVQPEMKDALNLLQKMYNEGLLDKEFGTKDNAKSMESVVSGKTGMFYGPHWMAYTAKKTVDNDPNAKWITVPLPTATGAPAAIPLKIAADGWMAVKKGTKSPENLIKMMNIHVEHLFGEKGDFTKYFTDSEHGISDIWLMTPAYLLDPMIDLQAHLDIKKAIADGTTDQLTGSGKGFWELMQAGDWAIGMMFGPEDTPFDYVGQTYPDQVVWDAYLGAPTPTEIERGSSMDELVVTTLTSIIQNKTPVGEGFDNMVKEWNALGGEQVTKEVNEALGK